jgi:hypothetical protein
VLYRDGDLCQYHECPPVLGILIAKPSTVIWAIRVGVTQRQEEQERERGGGQGEGEGGKAEGGRGMAEERETEG